MSNSSASALSHLEKQIQSKQTYVNKTLDAVRKVEQEVKRKGAVEIKPAPDIHKVPNQKFCVLSYVTSSPHTKVHTMDDVAIKISGCFPDENSAKRHAEQISNEDPRFDVVVVNMYVWGTVPMSFEDEPFIESHYADSILSQAIEGIQKSIVSGRKKIDQRKQRDFEKAERAAQAKLHNSDYKMPKKTKARQNAEDSINDLDREKGNTMAGEDSVTVTYVRQLIMDYCIAHCGDTIDMGTGTSLMREIAEKAVELKATEIVSSSSKTDQQ